MIKNNELKDTLLFALAKHDGQVRKISGLPYFAHPLSAFLILNDAGYSFEISRVALLHDLLEDTNTTFDELLKKFGPWVANIVKNLSKNLSGEFDFSNGDYDSLLVKTADTLSNVEDYIQYGAGVSLEKLSKYISNLKIAQSRISNHYLKRKIDLVIGATKDLVI